MSSFSVLMCARFPAAVCLFSWLVLVYWSMLVQWCMLVFLVCSRFTGVCSFSQRAFVFLVCARFSFYVLVLLVRARFTVVLSFSHAVYSRFLSVCSFSCFVLSFS